MKMAQYRITDRECYDIFNRIMKEHKHGTGYLILDTTEARHEFYSEMWRYNGYVVLENLKDFMQVFNVEDGQRENLEYGFGTIDGPQEIMDRLLTREEAEVLKKLYKDTVIETYKAG